MTNDFKTLLHLFECSAHGKKTTINTDINFDAIYKLSLEQNVWPIIFENWSKEFLAKYKDDIHAKQFVEKNRNKIYYFICKDVQRKEVIKSILSECKNNDILCILLKGYMFADLYANSEYRISGDVDLYVDISDESKVIQILKNHKFECSKRLNMEYHSECTNSNVGLIELHVSLYEEFCRKIWFDSSVEEFSENYISLETKDGYNYIALGYTDNYIFSVLHFIKHFISGGIGVRQLMDIMLFLKKYKKEINAGKYISLMKKLKFDILMDTMSLIAVNYLGFHKEEIIFCQNAIDCNAYVDDVLTAIENGGIFGRNLTELNNFSRIYTELILNKSGNGYKYYLKSTICNNGIFNSIFLSQNQLSEKYSYAKKHKVLLPIAWMHRIINVMFVLAHISKTDKSEIEKEKIDLLKKLQLFDTEV